MDKIIFLKSAFRPKLFECLKNYNKESFIKDFIAGIIVGVVALPLAIAFGIASGVSPTQGLLTAIVGGFIVSLLGGSKVQIGGPTGAFIVIVYGVIQKYGIDGLAIATVMAGVMLMLFGFFRLGNAIKFIPYPIIVGFTAGIAVTIFTTQVKDMFGLEIDNLPGDTIGKWVAYFKHFDTIDISSTIFTLLTIIIILITPRFSKTIPGSLIALILLTIAGFSLGEMGFSSYVPDTIGDHFSFSSSMPKISLPVVSWDRLKELVSPAFTIAMLGAIESLLSASVADGMISDKHNSNTELIAQGVANIAVPFIGGIPVTGAIARTMTNINNGGRSPISGIVHAFVLLLILVCLAPLTAYIPMAVLAGVLVIVSKNMSGWRSFVAIFKGPKSDAMVLVVTFALTVVVDLTIAIEIGLLCATVLLMRRLIKSTEILHHNKELDPTSGAETLKAERIQIPQGLDVYEISGPFFFGIANQFDDSLREIKEKPKCRIIRMRMVPFMDSTAVHNLEMIVDFHKQNDIKLILSGVRPNVRKVLDNTGLSDKIGNDFICKDIFIAVETAKGLL